MRISDWSSDVCSSELVAAAGRAVLRGRPEGGQPDALAGEGREQRAHDGPGEALAAARRDGEEVAEVDGRQPLMPRHDAAAGDHRAVFEQADQGVVEHPAREDGGRMVRSEEHTSELQSLMRISYAVFCLKK